jgi:protein phosphatase slingshot
MTLILKNFDKIIDHVYIGDYTCAYSISFLIQNKITYILVCARELTCRFPERFTYLHLSLDDNYRSNILEYVDTASEFINNAVIKKKNVLVHCAMGISRSPSIVIGYLLKFHKMDFEKALELVKNKHEYTNPQPVFLKQLQTYKNKTKNNLNLSCSCNIF